MRSTTPTVHQAVLERAFSAPADVAVVAADETLTFGDLAVRVTAMANRLRLAGVGPGQVVGLASSRDCHGVVGMLGILAAGGALLYLDPQGPTERIEHMLAQCRVRTIAASPSCGAPLRRRGHYTVPLAGLSRPTDAVPAVNLASDIAYVVYTSGSTGLPKGVAVPHRGALWMARQLAVVFEMGRGSRMLQAASWNWDAALCELLVPLAAGATVVIAPDEVRQGGVPLADFLRRTGTTTVTLTPSVLAVTPPAVLPALRTVVAVGEPCPQSVVQQWSTPGRRVLNGYGLTETSVAVSVGECRPHRTVHIGPPLPGVHVQVVDETGQPVPAGSPGELVVGGAGLALGYVDTDMHIVDGGRFVNQGRDRWFCTGDRVVHRDDGTLLHLGRVDRQVQLRGHRIELGEIEAALHRHPSVSSCAVSVHAGRLVAHVVPAAGHQPDPDSVQAGLRAWLPAHMVPALRFVPVLPLTANGKVNHADVAGPSAMCPVLALVRATVGEPALGGDEDFFDAGGYSLLAAELSVAIAHHFNVELSALTVVDHPTARLLREAIRNAGGRL